MLNRFAVSLFPKNRKAEAVNSEVLINRATGEIVLKTDDGLITSYNKQSRMDAHIKDFTNIGYMHNVCGSIYNIIPTTIDLPDVVEENISFFPTPMEILESQITDFMISVDADMLAIDSNDNMKLNVHQPLIDFDITVFTNTTHSTTYNLTGTLPLSQLNKTPFKINYPEHSGDTVNYKITINSLKIRRNTLDNPLDEFIFILHSILTNIKV